MMDHLCSADRGETKGPIKKMIGRPAEGNEYRDEKASKFTFGKENDERGRSVGNKKRKGGGRL